MESLERMNPLKPVVHLIPDAQNPNLNRLFILILVPEGEKAFFHHCAEEAHCEITIVVGKFNNKLRTHHNFRPMSTMGSNVFFAEIMGKLTDPTNDRIQVVHEANIFPLLAPASPSSTTKTNSKKLGKGAARNTKLEKLVHKRVNPPVKSATRGADSVVIDT